MKELQIIIKYQEDGDPLNMKSGTLVKMKERMTIGFKFQHGENWYGDYISLRAGSDRAKVLEAIDLLLEQSEWTEEMLTEEVEP